MKRGRKLHRLLAIALCGLAAGCATDGGHAYPTYPAYPGYDAAYGGYDPYWGGPNYDAYYWPDYGYYSACSPFCGAFYGSYFVGSYYYPGYYYPGHGWGRPPWNGGWPGRPRPWPGPGHYPPPHQYGGIGHRMAPMRGHSFGHGRGR